MAQKKTEVMSQEVSVNLQTNQAPILYTDSVFITTNQYGIIFNVAQSIDATNQQIVARFGMSKEHAHALAQVLAKHLAITVSNTVKQ